VYIVITKPTARKIRFRQKNRKLSVNFSINRFFYLFNFVFDIFTPIKPFKLTLFVLVFRLAFDFFFMVSFFHYFKDL